MMDLQNIISKVGHFIKTNRAVIIICLVFGLIYCSISLVNHYLFRTNAGDLGIYNQAIYDYAHLRFNYNTVWFGNTTENILSDHFTLLHFLIAPLYWIFKSYTLLVVQIVGVLFGGIGIYKYIRLVSNNHKLSLMALIHFFSIWGIYSAIAQDYHDNVVAAMFVPWFIYYFRKDNFLRASVFFFLLIISKENMIIWASFIALGMLMVNYKSAKKRIYLGIAALGSLIIFYIVISFIIPALIVNQPTGGYIHFQFAILGANINEAVVAIIKHPWDTFVAFFTNHLNKASAEGVKNEFFLTFLLSGGIILIRKPQYLIALLPVLGQKMFSDIYTHWGLSYHYSIEIAPILTIALFEYLGERPFKHKITIGIIAVVACASINIIKIEDRLPGWFDNVTLRFYAPEHYVVPYDVDEIRAGLSQIPDDAEVSAEFNLVPHLAERRIIFEYPRVGSVDYIALCPNDSIYYPLSKEKYEANIKRMINSKEWIPIVDNHSVLILKRNLNFLPEEKLQHLIMEIKNSEERYDFVKKEAKEKGQSMDFALRKNAVLLYDHRKQKLLHIQDSIYDLNITIERIKQDSVWLESVKQSAKERGITVEEMLLRAANYHLQHYGHK